MTPRWPLTPLLLRSHVWLYPSILVSTSHENTSKYVDTVTLFQKKNYYKVNDPKWPNMTFDPLMLRSHVWLNPSIIMSKSHANTSHFESRWGSHHGTIVHVLHLTFPSPVHEPESQSLHIAYLRHGHWDQRLYLWQKLTSTEYIPKIKCNLSALYACISPHNIGGRDIM